jgi:hypothetical protein
MGVPYADALIKVIGLGGLMAKVSKLIRGEAIGFDKNIALAA